MKKPEIIYKRAVGNSTRLVDYYIQEFFTKGKAVVRDHYNSNRAHRFLLGRVADRLSNEHPGIDFEIDSAKCIISKVNE